MKRLPTFIQVHFQSSCNFLFRSICYDLAGNRSVRRLCQILFHFFDRVRENGIETVEVRENGSLVSKTVDGVPQLTAEGGPAKRIKQ